MGHKLLKQHYHIGHTIQMRDGVICIGSAYVPELILIVDYVPQWGKLGRCASLSDYFEEMSADLPKLREIIDAPDKFEADLAVYTYDGGNIIEKKCEKLGWPNVTHDGCLMYANTFSADKKKVIKWAKENAKCGIEAGEERLAEARAKVAEREAFLATTRAELAKLNADYPDVI